MKDETKISRERMVEHCATPNDPRFGELWGMSKIGAPRAWDVSTGTREVLVAVSDTGIDYTHRDLADNIWTTSGTPRCTSPALPAAVSA